MTKSKTEENKGQSFSTDDFFINEQGEYIFDPRKIGDAHNWNQERTQKALLAGISPIFIDNTNTQKWEAKPYVQMALKQNYKVEILEPETAWKKDPEELSKKNKHGVPKEAIIRMLQRWEDDFTVENILKSRPPQRNKGKR